MKKIINAISVISMFFIVFLPLTMIQWKIFKAFFYMPKIENLMLLIFSIVSVLVIKKNFKFYGPYSSC